MSNISRMSQVKMVTHETHPTFMRTGIQQKHEKYHKNSYWVVDTTFSDTELLKYSEGYTYEHIDY